MEEDEVVQREAGIASPAARRAPMDSVRSVQGKMGTGEGTKSGEGDAGGEEDGESAGERSASGVSATRERKMQEEGALKMLPSAGYWLTGT